MRGSWQEKGWLFDPVGKLVGLRLGAGGCAEHEMGVRPLSAALGIPVKEYPIGIPDRTSTICPKELTLIEYLHKPRDKRRKGVPAAVLFYVPGLQSEGRTLEERLHSCELSFTSEEGDRWHDERSDVVCAWSHGEFGINVRGAENIARLKELHEAFLHLDIALGQPTARGFLRNGLSFAIASHIPLDDAINIIDADRAHRRLQEAVKASGIRELLTAAGKRWHALSPDWYDRDKEEGLLFFLNPFEQRSYRSGWFSLEQLKQWAENKGLVLKDARLEAFDKEQRDWQIKLLDGLNHAGLGIRTHAILTWVDEAKTQVGVYLRPSLRSKEALPEGVYTFDDLMAKYPRPAAERAPEQAQTAA